MAKPREMATRAKVGRAIWRVEAADLPPPGVVVEVGGAVLPEEAVLEGLVTGEVTLAVEVGRLPLGR